MSDLFGKALLDYYHNSFAPPLLLHNEYGPPESIPVERYFIDQNEYSDLEIFALKLVNGKVLDIGAATGRHALYLQSRALDVTAMDISNACCKLMKEMGVRKVIAEDIYMYGEEKFDTVTMLMNGIGIAGNIKRLKQLFIHLKNILNPKGQLLIDSSDISYLYEADDKPKDKYFGELNFHYEYKGELDDPFDWLYIGQDMLLQTANSTGWNCQIVFSDETDTYLARLQPY